MKNDAMKHLRGTVCMGLGMLLMVASVPALAQDGPNFGQMIGLIRWGGIIASVPLILIAMFVLRLADTASGKLSKRFSNRRLLIQKVQTTIRFVVYVASIVVIIPLSIRLDATSLTVLGGALAFAVGFAMRDVVASFIAGITIIFDRPFQVGDRITYAGEYGDIIKIGLRSVRMNTLDHNIITIPNNKIFTDITASGNYGALEMQVPMDFYIGIDQDASLASDLIREACITSPYVHLANPVPVLAKQVIIQDYVAFHLKARPYVLDCRYEKPFETDVHFRVLEAFRSHGIHPPAILHRSTNEDRHGDRRQVRQ